MTRQAAADVIERLRMELGVAIGTWANGPGDRYAAHAHDYDKVLVAAEGAITFLLPITEEAIELRVGDRLDLPAGTSHAATVGASGVRCLEAHLPAGRLGSHPRRVAGWAFGVRDPGPTSLIETVDGTGT
jgi:uncharacterized protein YjlB